MCGRAVAEAMLRPALQPTLLVVPVKTGAQQLPSKNTLCTNLCTQPEKAAFRIQAMRWRQHIIHACTASDSGHSGQCSATHTSQACWRNMHVPRQVPGAAGDQQYMGI